MSDDFIDELSAVAETKKIKGLESKANWGIALSGGGIRSATFCIGVLQSIAERDKYCEDNTKKNYKDSLLSHFDYLSTVSGGGYAGGFLTSLFVRDRATHSDSKKDMDKAPALDAEKSADEVIDILASGVPHRTVDATKQNNFPLAWLRNNGRYLLPSGTGDLGYAVSIILRNFFSLHYMIGIFLLAAAMVIAPFNDYLKYPLALLGTIILSLIVAYWLVRTDDKGAFDFKAVCYAAILSAIFVIFIFLILKENNVNFRTIFTTLENGTYHGILPYIVTLFAAIILSTSLIYLFILISTETAKKSDPLDTAALRKTITTHLTKISWRMLALIFIFIIDYLAEIIYCEFKSLPAFLAFIGTAITYVANIMYKKMDAFSKNRDLLFKFLAAIGIFCLIVFWYFIAVYFHEELCGKTIQIFSSLEIPLYPFFVLIIFLAVITAGYHTQFVNLSSLQTFYTAKLIRAYLGATNLLRATPPFSDDSLYVSEPIKDDDFHLDTLKGSLAPFHIINVTVSQTTSAIKSDDGFVENESIVLRDRKGRPLAVTPYANYLEGRKHRESEKLKMGQWLGISGAAFSTALGRKTTLGLSLLMGLANIRLGYWWHSKSDDKNASKKIMRNNAYIYLYYELLARFHGPQRDYLYLTDGGHYENTGIYELLRTERNVRFILASDNGADPDYHFEDLANLIRLAKADLHIKIEVHEDFADSPKLKKIFGGVHQFCRAADVDEKTHQPLALLLKATHLKGSAKETWILLLKPRYWNGLPADIWNYSKSSADFPQETTTDQFFDEAQWESYRALGYLQSKQVLDPAIWKELKTLCNI